MGVKLVCTMSSNMVPLTQTQMLHVTSAGLNPFATPASPADLNAGFPDQYIAKDSSLAVGVEPVVQAMLKVSVTCSSHMKPQHHITEI